MAKQIKQQIKLTPYKKLARFYKDEWGKFSLEYIKVIDKIVEDYKFQLQTIIDLACGTGNLVSELYKKGYKVIGVDLSPEMIKVAQKENPRITFFVGDMSKIFFPVKADIITCTFDSINYLLNETLINDFLINVSHHLNINGYFLFDANTPTLYQEKHHGTVQRNINEETFKQILNYDSTTQIAKTTFDFGNGEIEEHFQKAYSKEKLISLLKNNNFNILNVFDILKPTETAKDTYKPLFITQKI